MHINYAQKHIFYSNPTCLDSHHPINNPYPVNHFAIPSLVNPIFHTYNITTCCKPLSAHSIDDIEKPEDFEIEDDYEPEIEEEEEYLEEDYLEEDYLENEEDFESYESSEAEETTVVSSDFSNDASDEDAIFLKSLSTQMNDFSKKGYESVAEHFDATIDAFQTAIKELKHKNTDQFIKKWNELLLEFDPQYQLFMKLLDADQAMRNFSKETHNALDKMSCEKSAEALEKLNKISTFLNWKRGLRNSEEIEAYIANVDSFIANGKKIINS